MGALVCVYTYTHVRTRIWFVIEFGICYASLRHTVRSRRLITVASPVTSSKVGPYRRLSNATFRRRACLIRATTAIAPTSIHKSKSIFSAFLSSDRHIDVAGSRFSKGICTLAALHLSMAMHLVKPHFFLNSLGVDAVRIHTTRDLSCTSKSGSQSRDIRTFTGEAGMSAVSSIGTT